MRILVSRFRTETLPKFSLRAVADLLGHRSLKMAMRYAHLSPAYLAKEVGLLDQAAPTQKRRRTRRARKRGLYIKIDTRC